MTDGTIFTWFSDTARRHPDATAIEVRHDSLTYAEFHDLVERLAAALVATAGKRPAAVGLLALRTLAAYTGYLAALRLGATVIPLNPAFPAGRNRAMLAAAGAEVVVVDERGAAQAEELLAGTGVPALPLSGEWRAGLPARWDEPYTGRPEDVAYTLFTSGSTGTPKGVPIRHRNLGGYQPYFLERYAAGPGSRFSQTFDLTFDPSVFDMVVAWSSGGTLVVPQGDELFTPARFVADRGITHWFSVPSIVSIAQRLRGLRPGSMPGLRWSMFAGERLTVEQARAWAAAAPNSTLENHYGPTELTITCNGYRLPADPADWPVTSNGTVPIGPVYPYLESLVMTEDGTVGEEGELCVRGDQRFDGYLDPANDPGRFVRLEGARVVVTEGSPTPTDWYRSGDRVRVEDGLLVVLGRLDDQVKIHGYRVELGEIEAVLRTHPGLHDVVVLAASGARGEPELHALYTGEKVPAAELTETAAGRLPEYMRPTRFLYVDGFPVNASGKVDRRALAAQLDTRD